MLKKIALSALFAITFAAGVSEAGTVQVPKKISTTTAPQGLCLWGVPC